MIEIQQFKRYNPPEFLQSVKFDSYRTAGLNQFFAAVPDGTYVEIPAGEYSFNATINKILYIKAVGDVVFRSPDNEAIITSTSKYLFFDGIKFSKASYEGNCICVNSGYVRCVGCHFIGGSASSVSVKSDASVELLNCSLCDCSNPSIFTDDMSYCYCERCVVANCNAHGILSRGRSNIYLVKCNISNNGADGIIIEEEASAIVSQCLITKNDHTGLEMNTRGAVVIRQCKITDTAGHGIFASLGNMLVVQTTIENSEFSALSCFNRANVKILQTKLINARSGSILICHGFDISISVENCEISGECQTAAVAIDDEATLSMQNVLINEVTGNGILTNGQTTLNFENVIVKGAKKCGCQFNEKTVCNVNGLTIVECAIGFHSNYIDGVLSNVSVYNCYNNLFTISTPCTPTFNGLKLATGDKTPIVINDASPIFNACEFTGSNSTGFGIIGADSKPQFMNSTFVFHGSSAVTLQDGATATFSKCAIQCDGTGLMMMSSHAIFSEVQLVQCSFGMKVGSKSDILIDKSYIMNNQVGVAVFGKESKLTMTGSVVMQNSVAGIKIQDHAHAEFSLCNISQNSFNISCTTATAKISNTEISSSKQFSVIFNNNSSGIIEGSTIHDEEKCAIKVENQSNATITSSEVTRCGIAGIMAGGNSTIIISNTELENTGKAGVYITDTSSAQITKCSFSVIDAGIYKASTSTVNSTENTFVSCKVEVANQ